MSFDIFVITYRVTNFLPKLITCYYFLLKKLNFHFWFSPIFRLCPEFPTTPVLSPKTKTSRLAYMHFIHAMQVSIKYCSIFKCTL